MRLAVLCHLSYFWVGLSASRIHHLVERLIFEQSSKFEVETPITFCVRRKMPVNIAPHICSRIARITLAGMQYGACRASWPDSLYIRLWGRASGVKPVPNQYADHNRWSAVATPNGSSRKTNNNIYMYMYMCVYVYICICLCTCTCICVYWLGWLSLSSFRGRRNEYQLYWARCIPRLE